MLGRTRRACAAATSRDSLLSATWQLAVASDTSLLATRPAHGVAAPSAAGNAAAAGEAAGGGTGGAASKAAAATLLQPAEAVAVHLHLQASAPVGLRSLRALECIPPQSSLLPHAVPPSPAHALLCKPWGSQPQQPLLGWPRVQVVGGGRMSLSLVTAAAFHSCAQPQQLSAALLLRLPHGMRPLVLRPVEAATGMQQHRQYATQGSSNKDSGSRREVVRQEEEDVFSSITDKIPERPVSAAEGASYSIVILAALAVAAGAAYFVIKELLLEPKEYKVFNKALQRVQNDPQVISRLGSPITGYGQESRNRAARQRISHRVWTDEEGVERIQVQFHIREAPQKLQFGGPISSNGEQTSGEHRGQRHGVKRSERFDARMDARQASMTTSGEARQSLGQTEQAVGFGLRQNPQRRTTERVACAVAVDYI
ncbi:unnamed protein product [Closterium sp. NIES-65]|nr:unnamed protein product [Closterium sp. NIES-65]